MSLDEFTPEEKLFFKLEEFFESKDINIYIQSLQENDYDVLNGLEFLEKYAKMESKDGRVLGPTQFYFQLYKSWEVDGK